MQAVTTVGLRAQAALHAEQTTPHCPLGNEVILERVQSRLDQRPDAMIVRRSTVEHPFGTIKAWMGATHFKMKTL